MSGSVFVLRRMSFEALREEGLRLYCQQMYYAYVLRSDESTDQFYFGSTSDLKKRLKAHNSGQSSHTSKYKPWSVVWYGSFASKEKAVAFEKYLKTASGKAFLRKRLL